MEFLQPYANQLQQSISKSDIISVFNNLLTVSVEMGASDIHIEPFETYCRIRIRIDGILYVLVTYPKQLHENIIAKFKIESGQMRPDEKRIPQDARVSSMTTTNKEVDLRANTLPCVRWEKLVMRIVDKSKKIPTMDTLGIEWTNAKILTRNLKYPNWIILTTWPTGSGKTNTLYACLDRLNKNTVNITTFEDPVESRIDSINQSQIRADIGFTFAQWLRSSLRQDPDIEMVWEIRDRETLESAMEAAMTWHLVFSTIHTNSSAETITRMMNLWAKAYQIAGTFNLVMAQRLVRKLCPDCVIETTPQTPDEIEIMQFAVEALSTMTPEALKTELELRWVTAIQRQKFTTQKIMCHGSGQKDWAPCKTCWWTWYKGRVGIFEMMEYTDDLKDLLLQWKTAFEVEHHELRKGMINLERDGIFKSIKGYTSLEEIYRIVKHKQISLG